MSVELAIIYQLFFFCIDFWEIWLKDNRRFCWKTSGPAMIVLHSSAADRVDLVGK